MGSAPARSVAVAVELLRPGLYVRALDRPWIETPFVFQGFRIADQAEIEALRTWCRHVYIDLGRSDSAEAERVLAATRRTQAAGQAGTATADGAAAGTPRAEQAAESPLFMSQPYPERARFRPRVQQAARQRIEVSRAVTEILEHIEHDRLEDLSGADRAVRRMQRLVTDDPTASLWLLRMRAHGTYTTLHAVNACVLALAFGDYLGIEGEALEHLGLGALLMDVGRVTLPKDLLARPRALSATERAFVQRHVAAGVRLLGDAGLPSDALDIVRMHHERVDGQGYPRGVAGDRIPWPALIAGLVDSYDAMLRRRPWREAHEPAEAVRQLYEQADSSFGRDLVESFIRYLGAYPVGSLVELDNQSIGVVVGSRPGAGLWPTVLLLRTPDRQPYRKRLLLNLAAVDRGDARVPARSIRRTLTPREANVDVGKVVAREFGMAEGW
jgi:HD-GYP domain-containing protein (c-di-GMP phosphodiesterase class II)